MRKAKWAVTLWAVLSAQAVYAAPATPLIPIVGETASTKSTANTPNNSASNTEMEANGEIVRKVYATAPDVSNYTLPANGEVPVISEGGGKVHPMETLPPIPPIVFQEAQRSAHPMTNEQLREQIHQLVEQERILSSNASSPLKVVNKNISGNFNTGGVSAPIYIGPNYTTSIAFEGAGGSPWPVAVAVIGNKSIFKLTDPFSSTVNQSATQIANLGKGKSSSYSTQAQQAETSMIKNMPKNTVILTTSSFGGSTTLSVLLKGAPAPISIPVIVSKKESYGTVIIRMNRSSPDHKEPIILPSVNVPVTKTMMDFLNGIPPKDAKPLKVDFPGVHAWDMSGKYYITSDYPLISPAWMASTENANGKHVYELSPVSVLLVSVDGSIHYVKLDQHTTVYGVPNE